MNQNIKTKRGFQLVSIITIIPIVYLFMMAPLADYFSTLLAIIRTIAKVAGISAIMLFSLNMIFGIPQIFSRLFGGSANILDIRQTVGKFAFLSVLVHVISIFVASALTGVRPTQGPAILAGLVAFILMITFAVASIKKNMKVLGILMKVAGITVILAAFHALTIPSDVSRYPFLRFYIGFFIVAALFSYLLSFAQAPQAKQDENQ